MAKKRKKAAQKSVAPIEIHRIAHYAFFAGVLVAIIAGLFRKVIGPNAAISTNALVTTLVLLGLVVGIINLTAKETIPFLVAVIALMLAGIVNLNLFDLYGLFPELGLYARSILSNIVVFVMPAGVIVALKTVWHLASD